MGRQDQQTQRPSHMSGKERSPSLILIIDPSTTSSSVRGGGGGGGEFVGDEDGPELNKKPESNYPTASATATDTNNKSNNNSSNGSSSYLSSSGESGGSQEPPLNGHFKKNRRRRHKRKKPEANNSQPDQKRLRRSSTTDSEENDGSEISSTLEREAPDGGWGWVVVAAAFLVNLLADGVTLSFGSFFPVLSDVFGTSKGTTAWVGSLLASMPLLSGPIASSLTDRYGCKRVTICGGLLAAGGFALSYFTTSIHMLMLTYGIITGFGLSLCSVAAVVIVAYYFERKRSLATGLSVSGTGIGTFLFSPLTSHLIGIYGWRVTLLILGCCFLMLCACGMLMKDLEWTKKSSKKREKLLQNEHDFNTQAQLNLFNQDSLYHEGNGSLKSKRLCNSAICIPTFVREQERQQNKRIRYYSTNNSNSNASYLPAADSSEEINANLNKNIKKDKAPAVIFPETDRISSPEFNGVRIVKSDRDIVTLSEKTSKDRTMKLINSGNANDTFTIGESSARPDVSVEGDNFADKTSNNFDGLLSTTFINPNNNYTSKPIITITAPANNNNNNNNTDGEENTQQKQQEMRNYVVHHTRMSVPLNHRHSLTYRGAVLSLKRYRLRPASSCPDIISVATMDDKNVPAWKAVMSDIYLWTRGIFAWDNLSNTRFLLFIISNFLLYTWYDIPYYFLTECATDLGYTEKEGSLFASTIGICNVFGNVILGYIGDKRWANSVTVYGICISICGIVVGLIPCFFTRENLNYYWLCVLSGIFGLLIAANYSLTPVILLQVVSLERFANAYGLLLLVQGIGNLIGPPIGGLLFDLTGTWKYSFWAAGGGIFISNVFILAPVYKRHQKAASRGSSVVSDSENNYHA